MTYSIKQLKDITRINSADLEGIIALQVKMDDEEKILNPEEVTSIQNMLAGLIGDMDTNKKLGTIAAESKQDTGIGPFIIAVLKDISYRTRHLDKIAPALDRIWENFQAVQEGKKILQEKEKITLKQYGMLYDLANLNNIMENFKKLGLIKGNKKLEKLYKQQQYAAAMVSHLDKTFDQSFQMPAGSVVLDNTQKKSAIYAKELGFFEKLVSFFITKFGHVSKGMAVEENQVVENKISHINPGYLEQKLTLRNYLYSDVYRIKIGSLIDDKTKALLKENLGPDWVKQVEQKYAEIERQIHDNQRSMHSHIVADGGKGRQIKIGTALLQGGHKNFIMKDHSNQDVRDDIFGRGKWAKEGQRESSKVLCSEFIGKTIIAAVQELNEDLEKQLRAKGVINIPDPIVKSPISKKEKLHLLTPERLLTAMQERGAVEKVAVPRQLNQFVKKGGDENKAKSTIDAKAQMKKIKKAEVLTGIDDINFTK